MKKRTPQVLSIAAAHLLHDIYTSFLPPLYPLLQNKLHLTYFMLGSLSVFLRFPSILNPFIGFLAEKWGGGKYFVILTPFLTALSLCLIGNVSSYYLLVFLFLCAGLTSQFFHVPAPVALKNLSNNNLGKNMSWFMIGGETARTLGPIFIMWFIGMYSLEKMYWLILFGGFVSLFLFVVLKDADFFATNYKKNNLTITSLLFFRKKNMVFTIIASLISKGFTASAITYFVAIYLNQKGVSIFLSGSSLSIVALASILGVALAGHLADKFGRRQMLLIYLFISPLALYSFLLSKGFFLIITLFILGLTSFASTPIVMAIVQEQGKRIPAFANGMYMTANFLCTSLIVLLIGYLSDLLGIINTYYVCVFCAFLGFFLLYFFTNFETKEK